MYYTGTSERGTERRGAGGLTGRSPAVCNERERFTSVQKWPLADAWP